MTLVGSISFFRQKNAGASKMSGLLGDRLPRIVAPVCKPNRCCDEFLERHIVEAGNVD
jgi:hypothetical protein